MRIMRWHYMALALILALLPFLIRYSTVGFYPPGITPYHNLISSQEFSFPKSDLEIASYSSPYVTEIYDLLISWISSFFPIEIVILIVPLLISLACALMIYPALCRIGIPEQHSMIASILFSFSPVFISMVLYSSSATLSFFLILSSAYLLSFNNRYANFIATLFLLLSLFSGFTSAISAILLVYIYCRIGKGSRNLYISILILLIVTSTFFYGYHLRTNGMIESRIVQTNPSFQEFFSDLGGSIGFGSFAIFLAIIGIKITWPHKKVLWRAYISLAIIITGFFLTGKFHILINIALSILSAYAIMQLAQMRWKLKQIRDISFYLVLCGFLFSYVSFLNLSVNAPPQKPIIDSLDFLRSQESDNLYVLSYHNYGHWIRHYSGKMPYVASDYPNSFEGREKYNISREIFLLRNIVTAKNVIRNESIGYVLITSEMKEGLVWTRDDDGLRFLFRSSDTFKRIYNTSDVEIWEILY